jgi:signal transduction histidine kinase
VESPGAGAVEYAEQLQRHPFLANFLVDAEAYWRTGDLAAPLRSGPWQEADPPAEGTVAGREEEQFSAYEAIAVRVASAAYLVLTRLGTAFERERRILQGARDSALEIDRLLATHAALVEARRAAEQAARVKARFLALMTHEIRTPLNGVIGLTELTLATPLSSEQSEYLHLVQQCAANLLTLVDDVLEFSRAESGGISVRPGRLDLREFLREPLKLLGTSARAKGLDLVFEIDPRLPRWVRGDGERLRQIMVNLAGNAVKYTDGGEVVVSIEAAQDASAPPSSVAGIRFRVSDSGPGIAADEAEAIFAAFERGAAGRESSGTGLGLAISAALVKKMGGELRLRSGPGAGAVFEFEIGLEMAPDVERHPQMTEPGVASREDLRPSRFEQSVLLVEANARARAALLGLLRNAGVVSWRVAESWASALELLRRGRYALTLLDADLPGLEWPELQRHRAALGHLVLIDPAPGAPAAPLILKPVFPHDLETALREAASGGSAPAASAAASAAPVTVEAGTAAAEGPPSSPQALLQRSAAAVDLPPWPTPAPPRVLLVDDEPATRLVAQRLLESWECRVIPAATAATALRRTHGEVADLLLTDLRLPGMSGFDLVRAIRSGLTPLSPDLPVVAVTAGIGPEIQAQALRAGIRVLLPRPLAPADLHAAIHRQLSLAPTVAGSVVTPGSSAAPAAGAVTTELFSRSELLARAGGKEELLPELLQLARSSIGKVLPDLERAVASADHSRVAALAHRLRGTLETIGATPAALAAAALEMGARAQPPQWRVAFADLTREAQRLLTALNH